MSEKCVTCGLVFRTSNELDWHIREEHMRRTAPPPGTGAEPEPEGAGERRSEETGEREPDAGGGEPAGRPRWLGAVRRLFERRSRQSP
jgi:hypothetical protein